MTASVADRRARIGGGPRLGRIDNSLYPRVEQPPGHRPNSIEEFESFFGLVPVYCRGVGEKPQMTVDLFGRAVCDSPVVHSVSPGAPVALWGLR